MTFSKLAAIVALTLSCAAAPAFAQENADMTAFTAACNSSEGLLSALATEGNDGTASRTTLCECLVTDLTAKVSTADANELAKDLDGTATDASKAAYANYGPASEAAGAAFQACIGPATAAN
jgi:hypothetical protein